MKGFVKTGVSIPKELADKLEETMRALGIENRSQAITMAIREFIARQAWSLDESKQVAGAILVLYDHTKHEIEEELTDVQHDHLDVIVSVLHVHLSKEDCMEIIAVRGSANRVKELLKRLGSVKRIKDLAVSLTVV
ncbi:MAG: nickel-responsive transcriptional regulator NikR [Acidilobaceae archaeon]